MIAAPLNDTDCLAKVTEIAIRGQERADVRELAQRFSSTRQLARWLRTLPQRDDDGDAADGPRVACDVSQRVRLVAADPNCVERSTLYLSVAELIDPIPVRQLATIDTSAGRHTFPVEDGEPVILDPLLTRNALRAGLWLIQRNGADDVPLAPMEPAQLLGWIASIAEEPAYARYGRAGVMRVWRGREAFDRLLDDLPLSQRHQTDALFVLRLAGEAAPLFGRAGTFGLRVARRAVARLLAERAPRNLRLRINPERVVYWTGKGLATYAGLGALYDPAYGEIVPRPRKPTPPSSTATPPSSTATAPNSTPTAPSSTTAPPDVLTDEPSVPAEATDRTRKE